MNYGKYTLIVLTCLVVIAIAGGIIMGASGLGFSTVVVIEPDRRLVLLGDSPVTVSGVKLENYRRGDEVLLVHGLIAESYPGQTRGHFALRIGRGGNIPERVMQSLREMGWVE